MLNNFRFDTYDSSSFRQFCQPSQVNKNVLCGLVLGFLAYGHTSESELE
ncbi:hypothetical protein SAMN04487996_111135 [Dyadobacter soli]|uniref:Uncharacterized protein n=1 Tax=Dyadobacter soli TaxID=659014 RepID=A0A1G7M1Q0_9BACT|nr:hypothetical protein SAMN04487996_111135 [Dyadobacter soli]